MKDLLVTLILLIIAAAGFYAFQLLVLAIFGLVFYWSLPMIKHFLARRPKWR
jgi:hypothetical protein